MEMEITKKNQLSNELKDTMQKWRPFGRGVPAPRNAILADPELTNSIPNRPEAMQRVGELVNLYF